MLTRAATAISPKTAAAPITEATVELTPMPTMKVVIATKVTMFTMATTMMRSSVRFTP